MGSHLGLYKRTLSLSALSYEIEQRLNQKLKHFLLYNQHHRIIPMQQKLRYGIWDSSILFLILGESKIAPRVSIDLFRFPIIPSSDSLNLYRTHQWNSHKPTNLTLFIIICPVMPTVHSKISIPERKAHWIYEASECCYSWRSEREPQLYLPLKQKNCIFML